MSGVRLPSKWRDWCKANGLRPHCAAGMISARRRSRQGWLYLKGRGFVWRVNCYGRFQRGDSHQDFDRWALCADIAEQDMPRDETEFRKFVEWAIKAHREPF